MDEDDSLFDLRTAGSEFLQSKIEAGLGFAELARDATDPASRTRHRQHALEAYSTVRYLLTRVSLTTDQSNNLAPGLQRLRVALDTIAPSRPGSD
jgi:hypothetical protein